MLFYAGKDGGCEKLREETIQVIEEASHTIEFLPTYGADLNTIEKKWAQAKAIRKNLDLILINFFYITNYPILKLLIYTEREGVFGNRS